jgi:hypothetical protein
VRLDQVRESCRVGTHHLSNSPKSKTKSRVEHAFKVEISCSSVSLPPLASINLRVDWDDGKEARHVTLTSPTFCPPLITINVGIARIP